MLKITGRGETLWPKLWCFHTLAQLRLHSLTLKGQIPLLIRASSPASHFTPSLFPGLHHLQGNGNVWFLIFPLGSTLTSHYFTSMCFRCWVLKEISTLALSLGEWGVGFVQEKFNKISFKEGSLHRFCLTNACFGVPFPPVLPRLTEQGILGTVILKLPIGSPCDGHQEQGNDGERTTCGWGVYSVKNHQLISDSFNNNSHHLQTWNIPAKWLSPEKTAFLPLDTVRTQKSTCWNSPFDAFRSAVVLIESWRNYPKLIHAKGHSLFWFVVTLRTFVYALRSPGLSDKLK